MERIFNILRLEDDIDGFDSIVESIDRDTVFRGTNLWILVFAIFIASLGLNVNSTAVVIGAMLVSPLMGPIIGLGLGMAINDLALLRKALKNYAFAFIAGLMASTLFFLLSPLKEASSEIIARTSPNIYDVLIAVFGGFAGILAVSSKNKGNVIPGVAIATALMPPLCAAGYGLANWNVSYFLGATYLFIINTVFIAWATLVTARFLRFPFKHLPNERDEVIAQRMVWLVVLVTLLPSIYFGYDMVEKNKFKNRANRFVDAEAIFPDDYLLRRKIDAASRTITLTFGGKFISDKAIDQLRTKLNDYELQGAKLEVRQGFSFLENESNTQHDDDAKSDLLDKERQLASMEKRLQAAENATQTEASVLAELRALYSNISDCMIRLPNSNDTPATVVIESEKALANPDKEKLREFIKTRISAEAAEVYFVVASAQPTPTPNIEVSPG